MEPDLKNFVPLQNYILCKQLIIKGVAKKKGKIILLTKSQETGEKEVSPDRMVWTVAAFGPDANNFGVLQLGDAIEVNEYDAKYMERDGNTYMLTRDISIVAIIKDPLREVEEANKQEEENK